MRVAGGCGRSARGHLHVEVGALDLPRGEVLPLRLEGLELLVDADTLEPRELPKPDLEVSKTQQWLFANVPGLQLGLRNTIYGATELL